jgi:dTDP-4-dehydrorhamnose reductase
MPAIGPILVLGGSGMLGRAVGRVCKSRSLNFVSLDRAACDITQSNQVVEALERHRPAVVINCAAYTKVDAAEQEADLADTVNGRAVGELARLAGERRAKLVHFSTDFVFDGTSSRPYRPDDAVAPLGAYGRSKLLGERLIFVADPPGCLIVRTSWLFGHPGACFPAAMVRVARAGKPLRVVNDQIGRPTLTDDLAARALDLVERGAMGIYHLANAGETNWFDFAAATLKAFGLSADLRPITSADWAVEHPESAHRPRYSVLDTSAAEALIGRPMRPWQEALATYCQSVRSAE